MLLKIRPHHGIKLYLKSTENTTALGDCQMWRKLPNIPSIQTCPVHRVDFVVNQQNIFRSADHLLIFLLQLEMPWKGR